MLECHQGSPDREELVPGHDTIVGMPVEIAPLPDGRVRPAQRVIRLGLALHLQIMRRQLLTVGQVAHDVEEPVAHSPREVGHVLLLTHLCVPIRANEF